MRNTGTHRTLNRGSHRRYASTLSDGGLTACSARLCFCLWCASTPTDMCMYHVLGRIDAYIFTHHCFRIRASLRLLMSLKALSANLLLSWRAVYLPCHSLLWWWSLVILVCICMEGAWTLLFVERVFADFGGAIQSGVMPLLQPGLLRKGPRLHLCTRRT